MLPPLDLESHTKPVAEPMRDARVHDWSRQAVHPLLDDPAIKARLQAAVRLRQAERERRMRPSARRAFNMTRVEQRARAFGEIFNWTLDPGFGFSIHALSPPGEAACSCGCGRGCDSGWPHLRDRDAGLDHLEFYRKGRKPVAIVGQPYARAFKHAKETGVVAEVERERGVRILELDPVLGWYPLNPVKTPTALVVWTRR
jgi:hypothetical protein